MPDQAGTLERLATELANALEPLATLFHRDAVLSTLAQMGVLFPEDLLAHGGFDAARQNTVDAASALRPAIEDLAAAIDAEDTGGIIAAGVHVLDRAGTLIASFPQLRNQLQAAGAGLPGITPAQVTQLTTDFPRKVLDLTIVEQLDILPAVGATLTLLGLVDRTFHAGDPANPTRPDFETVKLRLDRLGKLAGSPGALLRDLYDWGDPAFDGSKLFPALADLLARMGLPALVKPAAGADPLTLEAFAFDLTPTTSGSPPGVNVDVVMPIGGGIDETIALPHPAWSVHVKGSARLLIGTGGTIRPPLAISLTPPSGEIQGRAELSIVGAPSQPFVLFGQAGGSRLEIASIEAGAGLDLRWDSGARVVNAEPSMSGRLSGGKLVIDTSKADGFIGTLTSGLKVEGGFDARLGWALSTGIRFEGSATIEIQIPLHTSLGPIDLSSLYLVAGIANADSGIGIPLELSVGLGAKLGPLEAAVERIGAKGNLTFPDNGGNLGPANLSIEFKPPNGVGLAVDAGVVKGGGYLYIDVDRGEYAGALELTFSGFISIKAIGIITTKNPDGSPGFSLLILMSVEFASGIQLGFGFAIFAFGGLLGLNRTMKLQALMEGVRSGAITSIMFPQNIVANAPKIISDLRAIFPTQQGTFLIGPMVKLGWGTPPLISVSLGIIIEIPGNIAILGVIKIALPTEAAALIVIQVNFAGAIEFDKKRLYFFAALFESRVLFLTLEGEMGLLVAFGDDANFVVSVGGFHPRYSPPPLPFPSPIRIAISLINESWARVRVEGYFAVTSNSVQFGAAVEVFFGIDAFNVQGHLAFDALFQFSPFFFVISISASFSVTVFGIGLFSVRFSGSLEGPTPWRVAGEGSISILFFDISVDFEVTWGESNKDTLPPIEVLPLIRAELNKLETWRALSPAQNNLLVSLRKMPEEESALVLHPVGVLRVSQRGIPLALTLGKVGNQKPSDVNKLTLDVAGGGLAKKADAFEPFAPAQFQEMSDADKLSRPAFSKERSGLELSAAGEDLRTGGMTRRVVRYEEIIIDSNFKRFIRRFQLFGSLLFNFFLGGAAVARSELSLATEKQYQPFAEKIEVKESTYTVVFQSNNKVYSPVAATFTSEASAQEFLKGEVAKNGNLAESLHVIPSWEQAA